MTGGALDHRRTETRSAPDGGPIRVLFVNPGTDTRGGAERSLLGLLDGLDRTAVVPSAVVLGEGSLVDELRARDVRTTSLPLGFRAGASHHGLVQRAGAAGATSRSLIRAASAVRDAIGQTGAQIVHTNGMRAHVLLPAVRRRGVATVASIRELPRSQAEALALRGVLRSADVVVANSDYVRRRLPAARTIRVIDNSIATPKCADPLEARAELGIPPDAIAVAMLVHFHPAKGHLDLLRAVEPLDNVWVILAGGDLYGRVSTDYRDEVVAFVRSRGFHHRLRCLGGVDDIGPVYGAADMVAHCSVMLETFGRTLVEAMLAGKPVIASAAGAPGEFVASGRNGFLYPPGDVAELRARIVQLASSAELRESLARVALEDLGPRFTPAAHATQVLALYAELVTGPRAV